MSAQHHPQKFILKLHEVKKNSQIGTKAKNLAFLEKKGFLVPKTYACSFDAYHCYKKRDRGILDTLRSELEQIIDERKYYSVRSSANIEDETSYSFAGQFETFLNTSGIDAIIQDVEKIWKSVEKDRVKTYRNQFKEKEDLKMGVIIQEMVHPQFSGVVFTRNPLNGLNEIIVESVSGLGDNLVQAGVNPNRWVYKWDTWIEHPEGQENQRLIIQRIVEEAQVIAKKFGYPVDLEWAYDGEKIHWLQLREITTLRNLRFYSNKMAREFLPGIIKPLVWSVNVPVVNTPWKQLFVELLGDLVRNMDVNKLTRSFYYRAYFNMGTIGNILELLGMPRDLLEVMAGIEVTGASGPRFRPSAKTFRFLPRMLLFALRKSMFSKKIELFLQKFPPKYQQIANKDKKKLNANETLNVISKLFELNTEAAYYLVMTQLLDRFYNMILRRQIKIANIDYDAIPFEKLNDRLFEVDPRLQIAELNKRFKNFTKDEQTKISQMDFKSFCAEYENTPFYHDVAHFTNRFGHLRDSGNDFSTATWNENPDVILKMITAYVKPKQREASQIDEKLSQFLKNRLNKFIYNRAMQYHEYRHRVNSLYQYGYGLFRPYYLHLAQTLKNQQKLTNVEDIFYLTHQEISQIVSSNILHDKYQQQITIRKHEIIQFKDIKLPECIFDDTAPEPLSEDMIEKEFRGIPTAKGYYKGPVKTVKGIQDFEKVKQGDVLVIPFSDVSWTPLFAKAGAVVSESGGILSHASIVAREYGIPAVVSIPGITALQDRIEVAVDGNSGRVVVLESAQIKRPMNSRLSKKSK